MVGYGVTSLKQPHHAAFSCPDRPASFGKEEYYKNESNPQILYGVLVSGFNEKDVFIDIRQKHTYTDVRMDYNAGFTSALARLLQLQFKNTIQSSKIKINLS